VKKKFENRLIFGEIMKCTKNGAIFGPPCRPIPKAYDQCYVLRVLDLTAISNITRQTSGVVEGEGRGNCPPPKFSTGQKMQDMTSVKKCNICGKNTRKKIWGKIKFWAPKVSSVFNFIFWLAYWPTDVKN